jgi:hypothetical protein
MGYIRERYPVLTSALFDLRQKRAGPRREPVVGNRLQVSGRTGFVQGAAWIDAHGIWLTVGEVRGRTFRHEVHWSRPGGLFGGDRFQALGRDPEVGARRRIVQYPFLLLRTLAFQFGRDAVL